MEARLAEVQKRLWWLCVGSLLAALLIRPQPENRRYVDALAELESFRASFVRKQAEAALQKQAEGRGEFSFARVQEVAREKRGPKLKLAEGLSAPRALSSVRLATLADAHAYAEPGAALAVGVADPDGLGQALAWRMARSASPARAAGRSDGANATFTLRSFELVRAEVNEDDVVADLAVAGLRSESLAAQSALDDAARKLALAEHRVEKRAKRRSSSLDKFIELRDHARTQLETKTNQHAAALARYEQGATRAAHAYKKTASAGMPKAALARVTLAGKSVETYEIPVRLTLRRVSVPTLRSAEFSALRAAGLWDELSGLDAEHAADAIQSHFHWHLRKLELGPLSFSGAKLLQLFPCGLVWLLALLAVHVRRAQAHYSPFTTKVPSSLPRVGFKHRWLELLGVLVLPLLSVTSATVSLWQINQLPILPTLSGIACLVLGCHVFIKLRELREQTISIVRSHSYPPPAHDLSLSP